MIIDIIVQARLGSTRLPGKVLMPIMGRPMIEYTIESLQRSRRNLIVVIPRADKALARALRSPSFPCLLGSEKDVASRFVEAVERYSPDAFVRICGDSPLIDWRLVNSMAETMQETRADIVSNVGGGFPHGQQIEIINTEFFLACRDRLDREHVTSTLYDLTENKHMIFAKPPSIEPSLVVDTREDFDRVSRIIERADGRPWGFNWRELQGFCL